MLIMESGIVFIGFIIFLLSLTSIIKCIEDFHSDKIGVILIDLPVVISSLLSVVSIFYVLIIFRGY